MEFFRDFLEFKKYYLRGLEYARDQIKLEDILEDELDSIDLTEDDEDRISFKFNDIEPEYQTALLFGYAAGLEDILKELPDSKVRKAIKKVFHTEERDE